MILTRLITLQRMTNISTEAQIRAPKLDFGLFRNIYIVFCTLPHRNSWGG